MNTLDDIVTGPGFAVVVFGCWTVIVAAAGYLIGKADGYYAAVRAHRSASRRWGSFLRGTRWIR